MSRLVPAVSMLLDMSAFSTLIEMLSLLSSSMTTLFSSVASVFSSVTSVESLLVDAMVNDSKNKKNKMKDEFN